MNPHRMLRAALTYAEMGLFVFPLRARSKEPLISSRRGGRGHLDATRDPEQIVTWWTAHPEANIGIHLAASGLLALDPDVGPGKAGDETLRELQARLGALPLTPTVLTGGGGEHLYFRAPDGISCRGSLGHALDVKHDGYVVAPPSVHPAGRTYVWDAGAHPTETPFADLPQAWVRAVSAAQCRERGPVAGAAADTLLGAAFEAAGMAGRAIGDRLAVVCPWANEHTDGRGRGCDSSTVILPATLPVGALPGAMFPPSARLGAFKCSHGHCGDRRALDAWGALPIDARQRAARSHPAAFSALVRMHQRMVRASEAA